MMLRCDECRWDYPDFLVRPFISIKTTGIYMQELCGICALAYKNKLHKTTDTSFDAPGAEEVRQGAIKWRKTFPEKDPKGTVQ